MPQDSHSAPALLIGDSQAPLNTELHSVAARSCGGEKIRKNGRISGSAHAPFPGHPGVPPRTHQPVHIGLCGQQFPHFLAGLPDMVGQYIVRAAYPSGSGNALPFRQQKLGVGYLSVTRKAGDKPAVICLLRVGYIVDNGSMSILWTKIERLCCLFKSLILLLLWCYVTNRTVYSFSVIPALYVFNYCPAAFLSGEPYAP